MDKQYKRIYLYLNFNKVGIEEHDNLFDIDYKIKIVDSGSDVKDFL